MAVLHLKQDDFDAHIAQGVALVDFWADWCGPCRMLAPAIERLAGQYAGRVTVGKVDIDQEPDLASRYGIMSIPTILIFRDGELVQRAVGVQPEAVFARMLDQALEA